MLVRVFGTVQIALGLLFWTGNLMNLIPLHMLLGLIIVLLLWGVAVMALVSRVVLGVAAFGLVWGVVVIALGVTQTGLLPGGLHWLVQVLHLLVGIGALALAERLARRIKADSGVPVGTRTAVAAGGVG
jgi:ABC-type multidrug transport system permease subunit